MAAEETIGALRLKKKKKKKSCPGRLRGISRWKREAAAAFVAPSSKTARQLLTTTSRPNPISSPPRGSNRYSVVSHPPRSSLPLSTCPPSITTTSGSHGRLRNTNNSHRECFLAVSRSPPDLTGTSQILLMRQARPVSADSKTSRERDGIPRPAA